MAPVQFKSFYTGVPNWTWEIDAEGRLVFMSEGVTEALGYSVAEMLGKTPFEFCEPSEKARLEALFDKIRAAAVPFAGVEQTAQHRDGRAVTLESCAMPLFDQSGGLAGFRGLTRDVTRHKADEKALRESEELLKEAQRIASLGHYEFFVATGLWNSCEVLDEILGIARDYRRDVEGWLDLLHPEERTQMQHYLLEYVLRDGQPFDREYRIVRQSDREVRWVHGRGRLEKDASGRTVAMIGIIQDITARKGTELALARSERRFRQVLDAVRDGLWDLNVTTQKVYFSEVCCAMLGYAAGEMPGDFSSWLKLLHEEEQAVALAQMTDCIENRSNDYAMEFRMRTKSGGWRWIFGRGKVVARDDAGRATRMIGTLTDVSERRQLEAQLRQAQKLEAVGQLAGGVAHDFNNILATMSLQLGMMMPQPGLDAELREGLVELDQAVVRATKLTRQLLMFSSRSVLKVQPLDFNAVVENLLKMLGRLIGEGIELHFAAGESLPQIEADTGMVEQVLMNLAVNARDAMAGAGRLTIRTEAVQIGEKPEGEVSKRRPGRFVCLSVSDTGCGMDAATRARLFEPFFTTKSVGRGTGLGLATAHGIVAQHRGWIEVESELGRGSCFSVYWPALERPVQPPQPAEQRPSPLRRGHETILVVEDEQDVRRTVVSCLQRLGYCVLEAADAEEALAHSRSNAVDLLFSDMIMPRGMDGLALALKLREARPALRIIISSGYSPDLAARSAAADIAYLPKPYELSALDAALRKSLDR